MKRLFTTTAAVALLVGSAGMALADCNVVDTDFEATMQENPDQRAGYTTTLTRDVRELRNAAMTLQAYGKDDACQEVADAIDALVTNPKEASRTVHGGDKVMGWRDAPAGYDYTNAMTVTEVGGNLRANDMLGADVRSSENKTIGEISDIVFDPKGSPAYAVIAYGGFLGLGEDESAVPFSELKVTDDGDVFYLAMTEDQLENAPRFERGNFDWMRDETWRNKNDDYYKSVNKAG
jgi:PRC-barrel domain